jgi:hypothetical protein
MKALLCMKYGSSDVLNLEEVENRLLRTMKYW